jgi:hypothetical protein
VAVAAVVAVATTIKMVAQGAVAPGILQTMVLETVQHLAAMVLVVAVALIDILPQAYMKPYQQETEVLAVEKAEYLQTIQRMLVAAAVVVAETMLLAQPVVVREPVEQMVLLQTKPAVAVILSKVLFMGKEETAETVVHIHPMEQMVSAVVS